MGLFDYFSFALLTDVFHEQLNHAFFNHRVLYHVVLELTILHILNEWQVELGHIVFVHVEEDVPNHDDALLDLFPDAIELSQELLVVGQLYIFSDGFKQVHGCVLHAVIQHLSVLVEDQVVGSAVEFFVAEGTGLFVVDLVDRILDRLPVLLGLGALHVGVAHLIPVNQKLVRGKVRH